VDAHERNRAPATAVRRPRAQAGRQGNGTGTLSLAAEVAIDTTAHTVSLKTDGTAPTLLTGVKLVPKPYWAGH